MTHTPYFHDRVEQPYAAQHHVVTMDSIGAAVDSGLPELFGWIGERGIAPLSAPFIRYLAIDMSGELEIELGVPISADDASRVTSDDRVGIEILPGGPYATLLHVGSYDGLIASNAALQDWAAEQQIAWDVSPSAKGDRWGSRLEVYTTNPAEEPDPTKWEVEVSYRLADGDPVT